jgi:hypothetical protein
MENKPVLERVALRYFAHLSATTQGRRDDRVHILDASERAALRAIERGAIARSALAGALSSVAAGAAEVLADARFPAIPGSTSSSVGYWGFVLGVTLVASILEILFLYWDALRSVHRMAGAAGLPLETVEGDGSVASALARAALELPNPPESVFGVDPRREASKTRLLVVGLLYKGKIALTTFLLKMLIRRVMSRAAVRLLPFVAVPVTALWNGLVTWLVLREARIRAMGPSALKEATPDLLEQARREPRLSEVFVRGVASSIVKKQTLHPNLRALLTDVHGIAGGQELQEVDSPSRFIEALQRLPLQAQRSALRLLCLAVVLDGKTTARERGLIENAARACAVELSAGQLERLRRGFVRGEGLNAALARAIVPDAARPSTSSG